MKLPAYPRTKPSGVEWLGDVPEHWEVKRGRFAMRVNPPAPRLRALKPEDEVSFVPMDAVGVGGGLSLEQTRILAEVSGGYTEFQDGDVVVAKITPCFENGKAALACGLLNGAAYGTTELHVLRAGPALNRSFLFYVAISDTFRKLGESEMYGAGGQKRVPPEFNKDFRTPLPPPAEQRAIAAFLDRETGRVDRLVAKKRELIERLKEKRTALISRTVTRGLPPGAGKKYPQISQIYADEVRKQKSSSENLRQSASICGSLPENPPLKPAGSSAIASAKAGLDWLGDIPEHWEVVPLRYAFYNLDHRRIPVAGEDRATVEKIYPYYGASGIIDHVEDYLFDETLILVAEDGANLLSRSTPLAFLATGKYWVNNHAHILKPVEGDIRYWAAVLQTYDYTPLVTGAAQPKLTSERLGSVRLPKPPPEEQAAIAAYLDEETAKLDALVGKVEAAVERLQEYRTALISAAVTGKIDVRRVSDSA
jgi:type I restriction enzyme S subunit